MSSIVKSLPLSLILMASLSYGHEEWVSRLNAQKTEVIEKYLKEAQSIIESTKGENAESKACLSKTLSLKEETKRYPDLLIFVSFSMPVPTLKSLAEEADKVGGRIVFRGLLNNSFKETALKLRELGKESLIDPTLFKAFSIKRVPTFVLIKESTQDLTSSTLYDQLTGNVTLEYALSKFAEKGEIASSVLNKVKGKPYV